jgi:hypothetical protein
MWKERSNFSKFGWRSIVCLVFACLILMFSSCFFQFDTVSFFPFRSYTHVLWNCTVFVHIIWRNSLVLCVPKLGYCFFVKVSKFKLLLIEYPLVCHRIVICISLLPVKQWWIFQSLLDVLAARLVEWWMHAELIRMAFNTKPDSGKKMSVPWVCICVGVEINENKRNHFDSRETVK